MPPRSKVSTRRGGAAAAAAAAASKQPKLSFGKTANSGISKPNLRSSSGGGAKSKDKDVADKIAAIERVDLTGPTADVVSEDATHDTHEDTDGKEQEGEQEHEQEHPLVLPPSLSLSKDKGIDTSSANTTTIAFRDQARQEEAAPLTPEEQEASKVSEAQIRRYWAAKEAERTTKRVHQQGMSLHEKILREFDMSTQFGNCIGIARTRRWKLASELGLKPPIEVLAVLLKEGAKDGRDGSAAKVQRAYVDKLLTSSFIVTED